MVDLKSIISDFSSDNIEIRFKMAGKLKGLLLDEGKRELKIKEINSLISYIVTAFIKANKDSNGLHHRCEYSFLLEKIIQITKTKKYVEKAFFDQSEHLISNQSNIDLNTDFKDYTSHNLDTLFNVKNIYMNIINNESYSYIEKGYFFILMPFSHDFDDIYKYGIKNLLQNYEGIYCQRADEIFHLEDIPTKIFKEIQRAEYIIADLTGRNPNVFYELGFAQGINKKNIILITRNREDVPFDLRNIKNIEYVNSESLQLQLKKILKKFGFKLR